MIESFPFKLSFKFSFLGNPKVENKAYRIKSVLLQPKREVASLITPLLSLIKLTNKDIELLRIKNLNPMFGSLDFDLYKETTQKFKQSEYKKYGGLGKLFLEDFIPKNQSLSPFFKELKTKLYLNLNNLFKVSQLDPEVLVELEKTLNKYFSLLEKEFLFLLTEELSKTEFGFKDKSFLQNLRPFTHSILFQKGQKVLESNSNELVYYYPKFYQNLGNNNVRQSIINLLNHDHFPESPAYRKRKSTLRKEILNIHEKELKSILKDKTLDDVQNDDLYDFLFLEKELFKSLTKKPGNLLLLLLKELFLKDTKGSLLISSYLTVRLLQHIQQIPEA